MISTNMSRESEQGEPVLSILSSIFLKKYKRKRDFGVHPVHLFASDRLTRRWLRHVVAQANSHPTANSPIANLTGVKTSGDQGPIEISLA